MTTSANLTARDKYTLTCSDGHLKMELLKGQVATCKAYALYHEAAKPAKEGEEPKEPKEVLSVLAEDGNVYSTVSPSFIRGFRQFVEMFQPKGPFEFLTVSQDTKSKRVCILFRAVSWEGCDEAAD